MVKFMTIIDEFWFPDEDLPVTSTEEDEIVYSAQDEEEEEYYGYEDRLDCGCCSCCGCSCWYEEEEEKEGYTFDSDLPFIYLSLYFDSNMYPEGWPWNKATGGVEIEGSWGWYEYNDDDFSEDEMAKFLTEKLGEGTFECLIQMEVEYTMSVGAEGTDWDSEACFELLEWRKIDG